MQIILSAGVQAKLLEGVSHSDFKFGNFKLQIGRAKGIATAFSIPRLEILKFEM
jgi:hypothetical protein